MIISYGTLIINKSGIENIGYGCGESLKKKFTSLTAVCNDNTKPISIICSFLRKRIRPKGYNPNYTKITKKNRIIKTLPHDSKSILPSIDQINNNYENKNIKYSSLWERAKIKNLRFLIFALTIQIFLKKFELNVYAPKGL
jgi:hypothetical protein